LSNVDSGSTLASAGAFDYHYFNHSNTGNPTTYDEPLIVKPQLLANFGTCNAAMEGARGTQTNSTAACANGTTATSAGATHCEIYCNGAAWKQTGL